MTASSFKSYLAMLALLLAGGAMLVGAFVVIVDPYGLYGVVRRAGFNAVKPGLSLTRTRSSRSTRCAGGRNSSSLAIRARKSASIRAPAPLAALGADYNLAIPGTGLATSASQFAQLRQAGIHPRTVIVGLEFIDFLNPAAAPAAPQAPASMPPVQGRAYWRFDTLFSLGSVKDAVHTLRIQRDGGRPPCRRTA